MGQVASSGEPMPEEIKNILQKLQSPDSATRELALDDIGELKPSNAVDLITPYLNDPDPEVRGTAACNLGLIQDNAAVPYLIGAVNTDSSEHVRAEALVSLAEYRGSDVLDCLIAEVHRPKRSRRPRQEVAKQLRNYDTESAVDALTELLHDDDVFVRDHAAESLLALNRPRLHSTWEGALTDRSADVREIAERALAELDRRSATSGEEPTIEGRSS